MSILSLIFAGFLFGSGLVLAGMTEPSKVIGFLDFFGDWDPSLAFVMAAAIAVHLTSYRWIRGRSSPLLSANFEIPKSPIIDWRLLSGSALFGVGWGLAGYCPGPALTSLVTLESNTWLFVAAMIAGIWLYQAVDRFLPRSSTETTPRDTTVVERAPSTHT